MANLKSLAKDTAIYGMSSIVGRFLNYLLVPLYTHRIAAASGGYGVVTNMYAYTALILVLLTFGMETTFFRFANREGAQADTVFSTALATVGTLAALLMGAVLAWLPEVSGALGYGDHPEYVWMMAAVVCLDALQAIPFALLRYQKRPVKFAALKLLFILFNIALNLLCFVALPDAGLRHPGTVRDIFLLNLVCTGSITFFLLPEFAHMRWRFDGGLLRRMLSYSWPVLVLGLAGIFNQTADKILLPLVYPDRAEGQVLLGVYGACVKIAMIMSMITQAFRYAYEPFVFAQNKEKDAKESYAVAMKYFIIFTLLAFLCVMGYMDVLKHIIREDYRGGLEVVPIVMAAEIMMGVYFNLSFWYKLIDRTIWGAWFSLAGCAVLVAVNVAFIPRHGYMACAWGGVAGYATCMVLSYAVGQKKNPIRYPLREIAVYVVLAAALYALMALEPTAWHPALRVACNTALILVFAAYIVKKDLPLASLPVVGKHFRKKQGSPRP